MQIGFKDKIVNREAENSKKMKDWFGKKIKFFIKKPKCPKSNKRLSKEIQSVIKVNLTNSICKFANPDVTYNPKKI